MPDTTPKNPPGPAEHGAKRDVPPRAMVEAAEHDHRMMRGRLTETISAVQVQLDHGFTDFEAVADVWRSLREQQDRPATMLLAAIAIVQLAKTPQAPPLGEPDRDP
jgi:hypothetical protein